MSTPVRRSSSSNRSAAPSRSGSTRSATPSRSAAPSRGTSPSRSAAPQSRTQQGAAARRAEGPTSARPTAPAGAAGTAQAPRQDRTDVSTEAREAGAVKNPVNFASWAPDAGKANQTPASPEQVGRLGEQTLRLNSRGDNVKAMQEMLNQRMGGNLATDGIFGKATQQALREFQSQQNLEQDGIFGKASRGRLVGGEQQAAAANAPVATPPVSTGTPPAGAASAPAATPSASTASPPAAAAAPPAGAATAPTPPQQTGATREIPGVSDTAWHDKLPANLRKHAQDYTDAGREFGVDPRFLAAISMQETGNGTSHAFRNKNNAMGIMGNSKTTRTFKDVRSSIMSQARSLRDNPAYAGRTTAREIQQKYAPIKAHNDPRGLNGHWLPAVTRNLQTLGADPNGQMIFR